MPKRESNIHNKRPFQLTSVEMGTGTRRNQPSNIHVGEALSRQALGMNILTETRGNQTSNIHVGEALIRQSKALRIHSWN
mmetsp:Transcript_58290/g.67233  ORF Transcript_58290/g.67233 Transcript_58290/m.67233 type:complete len:80 (+) Transcript_58290:645-884(+)